MSEDIYRSQFRLPYPLYEQLKASADEGRRSVNAELVARLEESFHAEISPAELLPASKAREIAIAARKDLAAKVRSAVLEDLNEAIVQGADSVEICLGRFPLLSNESEGADEVTDPIEAELRAAGYETEWDGPSSLWVRFASK